MGIRYDDIAAFGAQVYREDRGPAVEMIHADPLRMPAATPEPDIAVGDTVKRKGEKRRVVGIVQRITTTDMTRDREGWTPCRPRKVARVEWRRRNACGDTVVTHTTVALSGLVLIGRADA